MVLQLHQDTNNFEATSVEYSIIKTLGLKFLTNKINSTPYGEMRSWNDLETRNFGTMALLCCLNRISVDPPQEIFFNSLVSK